MVVSPSVQSWVSMFGYESVYTVASLSYVFLPSWACLYHGEPFEPLLARMYHCEPFCTFRHRTSCKYSILSAIPRPRRRHHLGCWTDGGTDWRTNAAWSCQLLTEMQGRQKTETQVVSLHTWTLYYSTRYSFFSLSLRDVVRKSHVKKYPNNGHLKKYHTVY